LTEQKITGHTPQHKNYTVFELLILCVDLFGLQFFSQTLVGGNSNERLQIIRMETKVENNFTPLDVLFLVLAAIFTCLLIRVRLYNLVNKGTLGKDLLFLSFSTSWVLFFFQYKALRKTKVFLAWTILAIIMFGMFLWMFKDNTLDYSDINNWGIHNYANGLKVPLLLLIIFWVCRRLSKKIYQTELLLPNRSFNRTDYVEKRRFNFMDYVWMTVSLITLFLGNFY
jgi:hypothetical protein